MSTFGFKPPTATLARSSDDEITGTPLDWILDQQASNSMLSQQMQHLRERNLPQQVVQSIVRAENESGASGSADCVKLLVCKSAPIIWGMQRAVFERIDGKTEADANEEGGSTTKLSGNGIDEYFKYLPSVTEFKKHGNACEDRYSGCKVFP